MKRKNHHNKAYPASKMIPRIFGFSPSEKRQYLELPKFTETYRKIVKKLHNKRQRAYFRKLSRECLDDLDMT